MWPEQHELRRISCKRSSASSFCSHSRSQAICGAVLRPALPLQARPHRWRRSIYLIDGRFSFFFYLERLLTGFHKAPECILRSFKTLPPGSSMATLDNETHGRSCLQSPAIQHPNPLSTNEQAAGHDLCVNVRLLAWWKGEWLQAVIDLQSNIPY